MPRLVVPIRPSPAELSRSESSSRWSGKMSVAFSAMRRLSREMPTPSFSILAISSAKAQGSITTPLPMTESLPLRTTPEGSSESL